ncbi:MAG: B12-binding domain-containing radical SAM protein [Candidatus Goldbacteria bacterium]|nr:B12-binding domain-containing radical SAM protein [Candidatus Goldiibacteriota bacterium]
MNIKKILFINPVNKQRGLAGARFSCFPPLSLGILAKLTPPDKEIYMIDENFDNFDEKIKKIGRVDLVGITSYTSNVSRAYEIAKFFKEQNIPVIMGGIHVSFLPYEALQFCDSVVIGEAEGVWEKVLEDIENNRLQRMYKQDRKFEDIKIETPRRDIYNSKYFWGMIQTSRGCPMNCEFCSVTIYNGHKYRKRPIEEIINELKTIKQKYICFFDDNIVGRTKEQKEHALLLFKRMVEEKLNKIWFAQCSINVGEEEEILKWMYKSGCRILLIGLESIDEESLKEMHKQENVRILNKINDLIKNIHKNGIAIIGSFIIGSSNDNLNTINKTVNFIIKNDIDSVLITHLTPFPGTRLYTKMQQENRIIANNYPDDWIKYNFSNVVYKHEKLSKEELIYIVDSIKNKIVAPFWMLIKRFIKTLFNTISFRAALIALLWNIGLRNIYLRGLKQRKKVAVDNQK